MRSAAHGYVVTSATPAPRTHRRMTEASHPPIFIRPQDSTHERGGLAEPHHAKRRSGNPMDDTSSGTSPLIPAISLAGVNLSLGQGAARVHILKGVTLNIGRGEAVGLIGPSRSRKSTLLMVMAGPRTPGPSRVARPGQDIGKLDQDALARLFGRPSGLVFLLFSLLPPTTA